MMRADMKLTTDAAAAAAARPAPSRESSTRSATPTRPARSSRPPTSRSSPRWSTLAGADAITTGDPNTYAIPLEKLIERDPQVIILGVNPFYSPTPAAVAARPGWNVMTAVKDDDIRPVNDIEITRPGPRLAPAFGH